MPIFMIATCAKIFKAISKADSKVEYKNNEVNVMGVNIIHLQNDASRNTSYREKG